MKRKTVSNLKLGLFVLSGTFFLVGTLYLLGQQRNLFNPVVHIGVGFTNVAGLVKGNNVRFAGINVGTVERITISNDTSVFVELAIRKEVSPFIKKTAFASLSTDGLMGNAVIDLSAVTVPAQSVEEGDRLRSVKPSSISELMRTVNQSGNNLSAISDELRTFAWGLNHSPTLKYILTDKAPVVNLNQTLFSLQQAGKQIQLAATDIRKITRQVRAGQGNLGYLLQDSTLATDLHSAVGSFRQAGSRADTFVHVLTKFADNLTKQEGALRTILADTLFNGRLNRTMGNIEQSTIHFDENMKALQHNFLLRGYFRKRAKMAKAQ
ncbi:MlaD family protein [Spirosoma litoris]